MTMSYRSLLVTSPLLLTALTLLSCREREESQSPREASLSTTSNNPGSPARQRDSWAGATTAVTREANLNSGPAQIDVSGDSATQAVDMMALPMSGSPPRAIGNLVWDADMAALVTVREIHGPLFNTPNNRPEGATKYPAWMTVLDVERTYFSTIGLSNTTSFVSSEQTGYSYTEFNPPKFAPQGGRGVIFADKQPDKYANEEWLGRATYEEALSLSQPGSPSIPIYKLYWTPVVDGRVRRPPDGETVPLSQLEAEISATIARLASTPKPIRLVTPVQ